MSTVIENIRADKRVHKLKNRENYFSYRGGWFRVNKSVPTGYWGRYKLNYSGDRQFFTYLWQVKEYIDNQLEGQK